MLSWGLASAGDAPRSPATVLRGGEPPRCLPCAPRSCSHPGSFPPAAAYRLLPHPGAAPGCSRSQHLPAGCSGRSRGRTKWYRPRYRPPLGGACRGGGNRKADSRVRVPAAPGAAAATSLGSLTWGCGLKPSPSSRQPGERSSLRPAGRERRPADGARRQENGIQMLQAPKAIVREVWLC